jgi:hypothetical protein
LCCCCCSVNAARDGVLLRPLFPFDLSDPFRESIPCPDWSQCAGGFACAVFFPRWPGGFCSEKFAPLAPTFSFLQLTFIIRGVHDSSYVLGSLVVRRPISCRVLVLGAANTAYSSVPSCKFPINFYLVGCP